MSGCIHDVPLGKWCPKCEDSPTEPTNAERATARELVQAWGNAVLGGELGADSEGHEEDLMDRIATALATARAEGWRAGVEAAVKVVCYSCGHSTHTYDDGVTVRIGPAQKTDRGWVHHWMHANGGYNASHKCSAIELRALAGPGEREGT